MAADDASSSRLRVRYSDGLVHVTDDPLWGRALAFSPHEWTAFLAGVRDGEFDLPSEATPEEAPDAR